MKICPRCNQQVSDEVRFCPFCSQPFDQQIIVQERFCINCGSKLAVNYNVCPNCGSPVTGGPGYSMPGYSTVQTRRKSHRVIWAILITILIIGAMVSGCIILKKKKEAREKRENEREYYNSMGSFYNEIAQGGSRAEKQAVLILKVWKNTIFEKEDSETDKYTKTLNGKGAFRDDFNDSLSALFSDNSFDIERSLILESQDKVDRYYKRLKNPPEKYSEAYEVVRNLYSAYSDLCACATNPTGNISSATDRYNTSDSDCAKYLKELSLYFE